VLIFVIPETKPFVLFTEYDLRFLYLFDIQNSRLKIICDGSKFPLLFSFLLLCYFVLHYNDSNLMSSFLADAIQLLYLQQHNS